MNAKITFLGGVGTVTGSKYLVESKGQRVLIDCGLFQGYKQLRLRNWQPLPIDPEKIDAVVLTHAHIDHSGYVPLLVKDGFRGRVFCTDATRDLCEILLPDSGFLQEKEAEFANRHGFSKHHPALPLYTQRQAISALDHFRTTGFNRNVGLTHDISARFLPAGHILGAAIVELQVNGLKLVFSGDLGRQDNAITVDPTAIRHADYLLVESTYGGRHHDDADPEEALADVISRTAGRGGSVIIPAFAVGRAQTLLFHIMRLKTDGRIPDVPVFLDSPMAIDASNIFCRYTAQHRLGEKQCQAMGAVTRYVHTTEESKALDKNGVPKVIISASGMATGGRVVHHLKHFAPDARNTILFTGFQAGGTRGAAMTGGAQEVKIHGQYIPVRAEVANLHMLSAHADEDEIMSWLGHFETPPKMTFIVHGEPAASDALRLRIEEDKGWPCHMPEYGETIELT